MPAAYRNQQMNLGALGRAVVQHADHAAQLDRLDDRLELGARLARHLTP